MRVKARKVELDGIVFDSATEAAHYEKLKALQRCGQISKLQVHPVFIFIVQGIPVGKFRPDFVFHDENDRVVVHEVKGWKRSAKTGKLLPRVDRDFRLRARLMEACFGLVVTVV